MIFSLEQVLDAIKSMELLDCPSNYSHCQRLTHSAQKLGFASYESLRNYLRNPPQDRINNVYESIMRKVCSLRIPDKSKDYLYMRYVDSSCIAYRATIVGTDYDDNDIHYPNHSFDLHGIASELRKYYIPPIYIINTKPELLAWYHCWHSIAYISGELTKKELSKLYKIPKLKKLDPFKYGLFGIEIFFDAEAIYQELIEAQQDSIDNNQLHKATINTSEFAIEKEQSNEIETMYRMLTAVIF